MYMFSPRRAIPKCARSLLSLGSSIHPSPTPVLPRSTISSPRRFLHRSLSQPLQLQLVQTSSEATRMHRWRCWNPSCRRNTRRGLRTSSGKPSLSFSFSLHRSLVLFVAVHQHGNIQRPAPGTGYSANVTVSGRLTNVLYSITLHFKDHKGNLIKTIEASEGDDILSLAHEWDIDLEGACEGSIACSTCHIILSPEQYDLLPEPSDDENDMLDLAFGLTDTSRLGCQVHVTKEMDGMEVRLPSATRNMFVDGKKPTHH
ncbi:putative YAH1-ferredoxin of the mitochondrial matrix [Phlebopus sp. FC_14]|nr:putative YAH1-ferredoxin of the mitochondrial matrix [Phlebopus sp. FC_14]